MSTEGSATVQPCNAGKDVRNPVYFHRFTGDGSPWLADANVLHAERGGDVASPWLRVLKVADAPYP